MFRFTNSLDKEINFKNSHIPLENLSLVGFIRKQKGKHSIFLAEVEESKVQYDTE
jgi:hypothetical protein